MKKIKKLTITFIVLDIITVICLFLAYGPISYFRDLYITTAMTTMNHQYLARIFYSKDTIEEVLKNNTISDLGTDSDSSHITFDTNTKDEYINSYEKEILERDKNQDYKVINVSGTNYKGHLVAIYDSKRIDLALADSFGYNGQTLDIISKNNNAIVAINASGFVDDGGIGNGGSVSGILINNSEVINSVPNNMLGGGIIGFDDNGVLMLVHKSPYEAIQDGMADGVQFGPFLIVNGVTSNISGNGGMGIQPRTVIAQRQDGIVLFLVIDGRQVGHSIGATISEVAELLLKYGAYNAANLDGGASSTLTINNKIYNKPCGINEDGSFAARRLPNAWILKK